MELIAITKKGKIIKIPYEYLPPIIKLDNGDEVVTVVPIDDNES